jgi:hypothetical protein
MRVRVPAKPGPALLTAQSMPRRLLNESCIRATYVEQPFPLTPTLSIA